MSWFPIVVPALPLFWSQTTMSPRRADWAVRPAAENRRLGRARAPRRMQPFVFVCDREGEKAIRDLVRSGRAHIDLESGE